MLMDKIVVVQNRNIYNLYTETNIHIGCIAMPDDGQFAFDTKVLGYLTKPLAIRWKLITK